MSSNIGIRLQFETLRTVTAATIIAGGGALVKIGTPIANPIRQYHILNNTDNLLAFSIDGVNDHFVLLPSNYVINDISSNQSFTQGWYIAQNVQFWVRYLTIPTTGNVYLTVAFGGS